MRKALSRAAPALTVFGDHEDTLWTLAPLAEGGELGRCTGPMEELGEPLALLAWGQSDDLPKLAKSVSDDPLAPWQQRLWNLHAQPASAAKCNDRRFCLSIPVDAEWTLPERQVIGSIAALDAYIGKESLGPEETWVAKAPWAASGRERVRRRGRVLQGELRVRAERLLTRYGELVIEPWMVRTADYGVTGLVGETKESRQVFPAHALHCDSSGVFRSIRIADHQIEKELGAQFAQALEASAHQVCDALFAEGYRGPFGIDAFVYTDAGGVRRLQALCEINARICFGLVARAQAEKLGLSDFVFAL